MIVALSRRIKDFFARIARKVKKRLMGEEQEPSVLAGMPTFDWNSDQSVRYEVAQEAIIQAVAAYTALIDKAAAQGDSTREEQLAVLQKACIEERNNLRSTDASVLDEVVSRYRNLVDELRAQAA